MVPTLAPGHGDALARAAIREGADLILVLGGDGSIHEAVNGMIGSQVPLGVLPGGTANVLCNELGFGGNLERAAERLGRSVERRIAVGLLSHANGDQRHFLLMGGAGLDAKIVHDVRAALKARAGKLSYWVAGLSQIGRRVSGFEIRVNGATHRCGFLLISRVRNYGGDLEIASGASLLSPDFEAVWFEGSSSLRYAWYMLGVAARRVQRMRGVHTARTSRVEFLSEVDTQIDGEYAGRTPAHIEIVADALTLLVPEAYG